MLDEVLNIRLQSEAQFHGMEMPADTSTTDEQLVRSVLAGDEAAFNEIFDRYKRHVTRTVGRFFRERDDIEECVQKAFTKAYFQLANYRGADDSSFPAWMTRIAVNVCYDEFRRRKRKGAVLLTELSDTEEDYLTAIADDRAPSAESSLISTQLAEKVLGALDPKDRMALSMVYSEDYSLAETADALGVSTGNLKSRLFRTRKQLKARFGYLFG
jgi:RNA polymerase sigma-70 factor, ECF subfamily